MICCLFGLGNWSYEKNKRSGNAGIPKSFVTRFKVKLIKCVHARQQTNFIHFSCSTPIVAVYLPNGCMIPNSGFVVPKSPFMKNVISIFVMFILIQPTFGQLKTTPVCPTFSVDVMAGSVNDLYPKSAIGEVQATLPCFSETILQDSGSHCVGVFYHDRDIYFFTERRYIQIGEKYKGKLTPALMGASRSSLFSMFGHPKLKDMNWDAFQMGYGTLILYYNKEGKINKILISSKTTDSIKLCE